MRRIFKHNNKTIFFKSVFLILFSTLFMYIFYVSKWYPGRVYNILLSFGFGLAVGVPFLIISLILKKIIRNESQIYNKNWFKLTLYFISIYISVILFSAFTATLTLEWQQFLIIFIVLLLIGTLPSLFFYYYGQYQHYKSSYINSENNNVRLNKKVDSLRELSRDKVIDIPLRNGKYTLNLREFCYAESQKNYLILTFNNLERVQIRTTIKQFINSCKDENYILQIHRAFIINVNYFNRFQSNFAFHDSKKVKLPVSKKYRDSLLTKTEL